MKIVFDTNCLFRVLPQNSPYRCYGTHFYAMSLSYGYTTEILQEYEEVLTRFYTPIIAEFTVETLIKSLNTIQVIPWYKWNLITADPDDNKFVDCALNAGADLIVTNDKHFNVLKDIDFPKVNVVDIDTFKRIISM